MLEDDKKFVFSNDPFREEDHGEEIFKNLQYTLNVQPGTMIRHETVPEVTEEKHLIPEDKATRTVKDVLKDAGRQILASLLILAVGFFALNWSAYYQIATNKWESITGMATEKQNDLEKLINRGEQAQNTATVLETSGDVEVQKRQIPDLNLEVMPIDTRLVIPRINQNIPIVGVSSKNLIAHDWNALEKDMQEALKDGVIHYPGTSMPGQHGNVVITGHSSYFPWDPGRFKDVFALLHQMKIGDKIMIYHNQEKYIYQVTEKKVVLPDDIDILKQTPEDKLTLITCTPVGTNLKRLIVIAKPITED